MAAILSVQQLTRSYGALRAIDQLTFEVPEGSVYGILGPNGSGKTTLLATLLDVLKPDEGHFLWFGNPADAAARRNLGILLETPNFYPYLSAADNLLLCARIKGVPVSEVDRALEAVGLTERRSSAFRSFSLGMKQRLALASAMLGGPRVIVLDEPTNGLDPVGIADIRNLIQDMGRAGRTVIMASHLLDEVERVCTHVAILKKGKLLASGPVSEVLARQEILELAGQDLEKLKGILEMHPAVQSAREVDRNLLQVVLKEPLEAGRINQYCFEQGVVLNHLTRKNKSLELTFLELTRAEASLNP